MTEKESEKEFLPGCGCCAGNLTAAEAKRIRLLAIAAITAVLAVAAAIAIQAMR